MIETFNPTQMSDLAGWSFIFGVGVVFLIIITVIIQSIKEKKNQKKPKKERF
jgi:hypothetical protein